MKDIKPFFVPPPGLVRVSPWSRQVDGDWEELGDYAEDWDYRTRLRLRCALKVDVEGIRSAARLQDDSPLAWSFGWRSTDTGLVGNPTIVEFGMTTVAVEMEIPAERAGGTVLLTRRLVLRRDRMFAGLGEARWAGSILWSDETAVRLTGRGAAFPTEVIDFRLLNRDPNASWYLDLPAAVDVPAMGSMMLLINSADVALVAAATRSKRHTDLQQALIDTMEEGVVEEFVRWALARWNELDDAEPDSVGAAARTLTKRVLPDPESWTSADIDSMALKAAIVSGARAIGFGRSLT